MVVSPEQIKIFQENGAILLKQVFSAEQVEMVKCGIQVFIYIIIYNPLQIHVENHDNKGIALKGSASVKNKGSVTISYEHIFNTNTFPNEHFFILTLFHRNMNSF